MKPNYKVILADCPWAFKNANTGGSMTSGSNNHYPVMSKRRLTQMDVRSLAHNDCALLMWVPATLLFSHALPVMQAWGFEYKTVAFTWLKLTKNGKIHFGMGFTTRQDVELCLLGVRGKPFRKSASIRQSIICDQTRQHSQKPEIVHENINQLYGNVKRLEMFSRRRVNNWHHHGNQVKKAEVVFDGRRLCLS